MQLNGAATMESTMNRRSAVRLLALLVVGSYEKFGRYVPEKALQSLDADALKPSLQDHFATGAPLAEEGWNAAPRSMFPPGGCCIGFVLGEPKKAPGGGGFK
jgi:hypothetical protein